MSRSDEKRTYTRYAVWFPVTILVGADELGGISRDASAGGMLLSTSRLLRVGMPVSVKFRVTPGARPDRRIQAEVVRAEANDGELMLAFPFRIALSFERPVPELPEELAACVTATSSR